MSFDMQSIKFRDGALTPIFRQERSTTAGGQTLLKDLGPMLWKGAWQTVPLTKGDALALESQLLSLKGGIDTFLGFDPRRAQPLVETASLLDACAVNAVQSDRLALRVSGLPVGFEISAGDYLSIDDGTNLHLVQATSTGGTGEYISVYPALRGTIFAGDAVALRYPSARFQLDPDSVSSAQVAGVHYAVSFSAMQVIL